MISVLIKAAQDFGLDENLVRAWAEKVLRQHGLDNVELSIIFVKPEKIRALNKRWRKINKPTSILSFFQGQATPDGNFILGDLVICPVEAKKLNLSIKFLIKHGLTNLLSEISTTKNLRT